MHATSFLGLLVAITPATLLAQTSAPAPESAAPMLTGLAALRGKPDPDLLAARPGEPVILEKLVGVRLLADAAQLGAPGFPAAGVDTSLVPWIDALTFAPLPPKFLGKPASQASL